MSETLSPLSPGTPTHISLEIVPLKPEEDDLDTLAIVGQVQTNVQQEIGDLDAYTVSTLAASKTEQRPRGLDIVLLITFIGASLAAYKDLLTSIFQTISTVVGILAKQGRIQEIEIIIEGKTLILRDITKQTARELIEAFDSQHPGSTAKLTSASNVRIKAKISKKRRVKL